MGNSVLCDEGTHESVVVLDLLHPVTGRSYEVQDRLRSYLLTDIAKRYINKLILVLSSLLHWSIAATSFLM